MEITLGQRDALINEFLPVLNGVSRDELADSLKDITDSQRRWLWALVFTGRKPEAIEAVTLLVESYRKQLIPSEVVEEALDVVEKYWDDAFRWGERGNYGK